MGQNKISNRQPGAMTAYPEVNTVLSDLLVRVQAILEKRFVGLYLYGSLASGDFNSHQSDIDFIVVTTGELPETTINDLETMHKELAASGSKWAQKLEGVYIPKGFLPHYTPADPPIPTLNEGQFYLGRQGSDWVIQRYILREQGVVIAGQPLQDMIEPVSPDDLRAAVLAIIDEWWQPMLSDPARLEAPGYQPYAVLSMCRTLYTLEHGDIASKDESARWAMATLDQEWAGLIERALAWQRGQETEGIERTLDFIRFTIEHSRQFNKR
jgi:predicted nucleotidyltransferase